MKLIRVDFVNKQVISVETIENEPVVEETTDSNVGKLFETPSNESRESYMKRMGFTKV
jgi:hypothetical protein